MNYIDLFAGAGGLSEGFIKAGFNPVAHVEMDKAACDTLRTRMAFHYLKRKGKIELYNQYLQQQISRNQFYKNIPVHLLESVIHAEIDDKTIESVFSKIDHLRKGSEINLIVGGPPCQAYSTVGRSKINSLENRHVSDDVRYSLYKQYGRFLQRYQPACFVFENVLGLLSAENGTLITKISKFFESECGYKTQWQVLEANKYGVLQVRKRVILIGRRGNDSFDYPEPDTITRQRDWTVGDALLADLEPLSPGEEKHISSYTTEKASSYLSTFGIRSDSNFVTQHITRAHNERDLAIYKLAIEKWQSRLRLKYTDVPEKLRTHKNLNAFLDRYKVVDPQGLCHTVVAHLSKDGHYYIYPNKDQIRSISVREAARIQSFPDDFYFEGGRTAAYRQIGNAVPPLLAECIANRLRKTFFQERCELHSANDTVVTPI
ncbi:DNA cytosine methyltransferase [Rudanella lutea]|uniref:DNA cytosine methyltransferase n=1 Tax=Rudanella lutea TaxID=451374 RepID=UPI00036612D0|nr:DNA cytosine methyltransferase [Rudanella lutea]